MNLKKKFPVEFLRLETLLTELASEWTICRETTIEALLKLADDLDRFQRGIESNKRKLSLTGIAGGGLMVLGIGMSVFTGGASLGLTAMGATVAGAGCSVVSGVGGVYQDKTEKKKNEEMINEANIAVENFTNISNLFAETLKELQELAEKCNVFLTFKHVEGDSDGVSHDGRHGEVTRAEVACSSSVLSALSGLGLIVVKSSLAARAVDPRTLQVVNLVGKALSFMGITDGVSKVAYGLAGVKSLTSMMSRSTPALGAMGVAGRVVAGTGGVLSVLSVGLDFKNYLDSNMKMNADNPSKVATKIREMADELKAMVKPGCRTTKEL